MASHTNRRSGPFKVRLTVLCAKNLIKREFLRNPDPFAKVTVDGSGQCFCTNTCTGTLDPRWNQHFDLLIGHKDCITVTVWNQKKVHKKQGAGFLGCLRIFPNAIQRLQDTGYQKLELQKHTESDSEGVKGQLVISLSVRERGGPGPSVTTPMSLSNNIMNQVVGPASQSPLRDDLASGWEERRTTTGRVQYVNVFTRTTQWERPRSPAKPEHKISNQRPRSLAGLPSSDRLKGGVNEDTSNGDYINAPAAVASTSSTAQASSSSTSQQQRRNSSYLPPSHSHNHSNLSNVSTGSAASGGSGKGSSGIRTNPTASVNRISAGLTAGNASSLPPSVAVSHHSHHSHSSSMGGSTSSANAHGLSGKSSNSSGVGPSTLRQSTSASALLASSSNGSPMNSAVSSSANDGMGSSSKALGTPSGCTQYGGGTTPSDRGSSQFVRRRSERHRHYMNRSHLHEATQAALELPDGYEQRTTQQGQVYFVHKNTGLSTWHDPRVPRDLSELSEDDLGSMPAGWEERRTPNGRIYYVDHNNKTTQFTDPRLSINLDKIQHRLLNSKDHNSVPTANGAGPTVAETERSKKLPPPPSHAPAASVGAYVGAGSGEQVPKYKRDLVQKLKVLRTELQQNQPQAGHCRMEINRDEIFEDSYRQVMKMRPKDLRKRLMVKFKGEEGLDYGGVAREWLYLLSHEMLSPSYGLFQYSREDIYTLQINPDSGVNPDHLSYFHFVGRIIGLAIYHGHYVDGGFSLPFYKQLLGKATSLQDLEPVDPQLHNSLVWILENNIEGVIHNTFSADHEAYGERQVHELKPGGKDIAVTDENKKEYVWLYVKWRLMVGIEAQFLSLRQGFHELIPQHLLKLFDERELELVIGGLGKLDLKDWHRNTKLKHCTADSSLVRWFWKIVESYDEEKRARLLQFVTGSSRVPLQGFKALQGSTGAQGPRLFTIHQTEASTDNLPKAHTCFNRIDMPPYETYEKMFEKLTCAVEETCGFAVE